MCELSLFNPIRLLRQRKGLPASEASEVSGIERDFSRKTGVEGERALPYVVRRAALFGIGKKFAYSARCLERVGEVVLLRRLLKWPFLVASCQSCTCCDWSLSPRHENIRN